MRSSRISSSTFRLHCLGLIRSVRRGWRFNGISDTLWLGGWCAGRNLYRHLPADGIWEKVRRYASRKKRGSVCFCAITLGQAEEGRKSLGHNSPDLPDPKKRESVDQHQLAPWC